MQSCKHLHRTTATATAGQVDLLAGQLSQLVFTYGMARLRPKQRKLTFAPSETSGGLSGNSLTDPI